MGALSTCCPTVQPELTEQGHKLDRIGTVGAFTCSTVIRGLDPGLFFTRDRRPPNNHGSEHLLSSNQDGDIVAISCPDIVDDMASLLYLLGPKKSKVRQIRYVTMVDIGPTCESKLGRGQECRWPCPTTLSNCTQRSEDSPAGRCLRIAPFGPMKIPGQGTGSPPRMQVCMHAGGVWVKVITTRIARSAARPPAHRH
jgi:hypothetical protein